MGSPPVNSTSLTLVLSQVANQLIHFLVGELEVFVANELGPAEAEGAVRVAGLPVCGEEENGLAVLVLQSRNGLAIDVGHVVGHLPGRVRVEPVADAFDRRIDFWLCGFVADQVANFVEFVFFQHPRAGEDQVEDGVIGHVGPVDQLIHHVLVGSEGQHQ